MHEEKIDSDILKQQNEFTTSVTSKTLARSLLSLEQKVRRTKAEK
jgi:hypothetical protein